MNRGRIPETENQRTWRPAAHSHRSGDWSPERVSPAGLTQQARAMPSCPDFQNRLFPMPPTILSSKTYLWTQAGACKHLEEEE